MARLAYNTFEGGTDGTGITSGNSGGSSGDAFSTISGTADFDDDAPAPLVGTMSGYVNAASGATSSVRLDYSSATTVYGRFYFAKTGNPTATTTLARLFASGTGGVDLRVSTTGALIMRNAASSTIFTSAALANSTLHRIEFAIVHSDTVGRMMLRIYSGSNAHGTIPDLEYGDDVTDRDTNASSDNFRFGVLSNPSTGGWSAWFDDIEIDDADWVGPSFTVPDAISDLAGTAGDTEVVLTNSAPTTTDAITDYVFQYSDGTQTASALGTVTSENGTSLGAANAQPLPTSAASGDLIVAIVGNDSPGATSLTASTGWTVLSYDTQGAQVVKSAVMARVLDGTTGDNILSITGAAQDYAVAILRFPSGQHGCTNASLKHDIALGVSRGASGNADPPSVDAGSSADRVWVTAAVLDCTTGSTISAVPTNYTSQADVLSANSTTSVRVHAATRDLSATQTEDPGTFTNTSRNWIAYTIAIPPAEWVTFSDGTSSSTGATVTGLTNGDAYTFRAAAVNAYGQGPWSNEAGPYTPTSSGATLTVNDATSGSTVDNVTLTQAHTLTVADSSSGSTVDALVLTQAHALAVADSSSGSTIDNVTLTTEAALAVNDATSGSTVDNVTLTQAHTLTVADSTSGSTVDAVTLTQAHSLTVADSTSGSTVDNVTLTQAHTLAVADASSGSTIDNVTLAAAGSLSVNDATSASTVDNVTLTQAHVIAVADALTSTTIDGVTIAQVYFLAVADSTSSTTIDGLTLTQAHTLAVADITSATTIDGVVLSTDSLAVPWLHGMRPVRGGPPGPIVGRTPQATVGRTPDALVGATPGPLVGRTPATITGGPS